MTSRFPRGMVILAGSSCRPLAEKVARCVAIQCMRDLCRLHVVYPATQKPYVCSGVSEGERLSLVGK